MSSYRIYDPLNQDSGRAPSGDKVMKGYTVKKSGVYSKKKLLLHWICCGFTHIVTDTLKQYEMEQSMNEPNSSIKYDTRTASIEMGDVNRTGMEMTVDTTIVEQKKD